MPVVLHEAEGAPRRNCRPSSGVAVGLVVLCLAVLAIPVLPLRVRVAGWVLRTRWQPARGSVLATLRRGLSIYQFQTGSQPAEWDCYLRVGDWVYSLSCSPAR